MAIFLYQIGIFTAVLIASSFGKNSRNTSIILISIFTLLQVFMSWLLLLQFITIFISYTISNQIFFAEENNESEIDFDNQKNRVDQFIEETRNVSKKSKRGFEVGCGYILMLFSIVFCTSSAIKLISGKSELGFAMPIILIFVFFIVGIFGWLMTKK